MTISSTDREAGPFIGNDVTTALPFDFKVFQAADLLVVQLDTIMATESTLVLGTDYTVSLNADQNANPGGTVSLISPLATGLNVTVTSNLKYKQPTDLTNQGGFYPRVINDALDRLTIFVQQLLSRINRSIRLPLSVSGVDTELPVPESNKIIAWNQAANGLQNLDSSQLATIVAFGTSNADLFSGDGVETDFILSGNPGALNNLDVSIGGVTQTPGLDYTWTSGLVLSFTTAPPLGTNNVLVRYLQGLPQGFTDADASAFTPAGTGALATTVQTELNRQRVTPQRFGAVGGGLADDTTAFTRAAAAARLVFVPFVSGGYNVADTVTAGSTTFIFEGGPTQLVGSATAANLNAMFLDGGSMRGVPFAALLRSSRIGIVAGAIRQDSGTRTRWNYISDSSHVPVGVSGSFATASGAAITVPFEKTYSRIISFVAGPDETFANAMGMTVGASVGLSSAILQASANFGAGFSCRYDGANWIFSQGTGQVINPVFVNYAGVSGLLTIDHEYCRGIGVNLNPWTVSGAILNPYIPCVRSVAQGQMLIQFMDPTTGNVYTGGANTRMAIYITKQNASGLFLDGTQNSDIVNNVDMSSGNIWFYGIFEE